MSWGGCSEVLVPRPPETAQLLLPLSSGFSYSTMSFQQLLFESENSVFAACPVLSSKLFKVYGMNGGHYKRPLFPLTPPSDGWGMGPTLLQPHSEVTGWRAGPEHRVLAGQGAVPFHIQVTGLPASKQPAESHTARESRGPGILQAALRFVFCEPLEDLGAVRSSSCHSTNSSLCPLSA